MSRGERLLGLLQALRRRRAPVSGADLARELEVSLRTLYRDIESLRAQGARIEGEVGVGYVLRPGFTLPPLMFLPAEIDALTLGLRWVAGQGDVGLAAASRDALSRIVAVLPPELAQATEHSPLLPVVRRPEEAVAPLPALRQALAAHVKVRLDYVDGKGEATRRVVWPVSIGFFAETLMLAAWCELRTEFRHFRLDRMREPALLADRIPRPRRTLLREWRAATGIDATADGI